MVERAHTAFAGGGRRAVTAEPRLPRACWRRSARSWRCSTRHGAAGRGRHRADADLPVIFASAYGEGDTVVRALEAARRTTSSSRSRRRTWRHGWGWRCVDMPRHRRARPRLPHARARRDMRAPEIALETPSPLRIAVPIRRIVHRNRPKPAGKSGRGAVNRLGFDDLRRRMTESRRRSRSTLGRPSLLRTTSSQFVSNPIPFDDGSGVPTRSHAAIVEPYLTWKRPLPAHPRPRGSNTRAPPVAWSPQTRHD